MTATATTAHHAQQDRQDQPEPAFTPTRLQPTEIAPETFLIHNHEGEGKAPVVIALNSMVIRSQEPVIVDTGAAEHQSQFLTDVFSLVEPTDVRWVFLSHDDIDHTGNVNVLMDACPNATLVLNWFMVERMGAALQVAPSRWRWIGDGESLDIGDRVLQAVRPPIYDSPTTRGLYDPTTGVYWSSDGFATPMLTPVSHVADLDHNFWIDGMATFDNYISPWLRLVDTSLFASTVDRVAALRPQVIAGCHTPAIDQTRIDQAIAAAHRAPVADFSPQPDQAVLQQIQRALSLAA